MNINNENKIDLSKKLLILGGTTLMINVVKIAKDMGIYTIVTDRDPASPAKKMQTWHLMSAQGILMNF